MQSTETNIMYNIIIGKPNFQYNENQLRYITKITLMKFESDFSPFSILDFSKKEFEYIQNNFFLAKELLITGEHRAIREDFLEKIRLLKVLINIDFENPEIQNVYKSNKRHYTEEKHHINCLKKANWICDAIINLAKEEKDIVIRITRTSTFMSG